MQNKEVCEICLRRISNPVCTKCYLKHAILWLRDFGLSDSQIKKVVERIKARLPKETLNEHRCILCGKNTVSICAYCAFLRSSDMILKLDADEEYKNAFLESANFKLEEDSRTD